MHERLEARVLHGVVDFTRITKIVVGDPGGTPLLEIDNRVKPLGGFGPAAVSQQLFDLGGQPCFHAGTLRQFGCAARFKLCGWRHGLMFCAGVLRIHDEAPAP